MTNDIADSNPEDAVPCFALSKNDSYVMSASGGKISLFNMMTFKVTYERCHYSRPCFGIMPINRFQSSWLSADYDNVHASTTCGNLSCFPSSG